MNAHDEAFLEGFTKAAADNGVAPEAVSGLLELAGTIELLEKDAAFREGFEQEMEKCGQHFWNNVMGGAAAGGLGGTAVAPGIGTLIGAVGGGLLGAGRGVWKNWRATKEPHQFKGTIPEIQAQWNKQLDRMGMPLDMRPQFGVYKKQEPQPRQFGYGYGYTRLPSRWGGPGGY